MLRNQYFCLRALASAAAAAIKLLLGLLGLSDQLLRGRAINTRSSLKLKAMQLEELLQRIHDNLLLTNH